MSLIPSAFDFDPTTDIATDTWAPRFDRMLRNFEQQFLGAPVGTSTALSPWTMQSAPFGGAGAVGRFDYYPAMDIADTDREVVVHTDLPGMRKEDIDIEVVGNRLVIKGESKKESETGDARWRRRERSFGRFERRVNLPREADPNNVVANYNNGVLEVRVAKNPSAQQQRKAIAVQ